MLFFLRFSTKGSQPWHLLRVGFLVAFAVLAASAQTGTVPANLIHIDAGQPSAEAGPARYDESFAKSPSGQVIGLNSRYLTLNGKPWLPVMGEFHFSRYPRAQWEEELLKMKAAGVNIVATYVIWIHHEETRGQFDWQGQRDLRAFAQLCAKHGLYLEPRVGPWAHAEARNGGLPDWVVRQGPTRMNDRAYLAAVQNWYSQIGQQLQGLLWKDGGPVIGIQLENEYAQRGPGAGEEHILALKKLAIQSGLDVPFYFVTGWDSAVVPERAVLPVYGGGYPDAPWDGSLTKLPPQEVYAFRFQSRVAANMGAIGAASTPAANGSQQEPLPYLTAEIGGGIEDTYHRRPVISSDDIAAMMPVMLGSGVNLYGTYMFQGGENPDGRLTTLEESQATGYPTDVPIKSYDFQAPLGEFGEERDSFRKLKVFQYFLNDFGELLAPMTIHAPLEQPRDAADFSVLRSSVRSNGDAGFLFVNNYVRGSAMPARPAAQFEIRLPGGTLEIPRRPVDIPSGAYFLWPFHLHLGALNLRYSTAQLFTEIPASAKNGKSTTLYFEAINGIPAEFAFEEQNLQSLEVSSGQSVRDAGAVFVSDLRPGIDSSIDLTATDGERFRIVLLTAEEAENAWKIRTGGQEHLLITAQEFFADPATGEIWLRSRGTPQFGLTIAPPFDTAPQASLPLTETALTAHSASYASSAKPLSVALNFSRTQQPGAAPAVKIGPAPSWRKQGVAMAPSEADLPQAAQWSLTVPEVEMNGLSDLFLQIDYQGDLARLSSGNHLLTDNFYNGSVWCVGLRRFLDLQKPNRFDLKILPLRKDAPVYFELPAPLPYDAQGQIDNLKSLTLVPEYQLILKTGSQRP